MTTRPIPSHLPAKPAFKAACNGCGVCCAIQLCREAQRRLPGVSAPCPFLVVDDARAWCGLVRAEPEQAEEMLIGTGCSMLDDRRPEWAREM